MQGPIISSVSLGVLLCDEMRHRGLPPKGLEARQDGAILR